MGSGEQVFRQTPARTIHAPRVSLHRWRSRTPNAERLFSETILNNTTGNTRQQNAPGVKGAVVVRSENGVHGDASHLWNRKTERGSEIGDLAKKKLMHGDAEKREKKKSGRQQVERDRPTLLPPPGHRHKYKDVGRMMMRRRSPLTQRGKPNRRP